MDSIKDSSFFQLYDNTLTQGPAEEFLRRLQELEKDLSTRLNPEKSRKFSSSLFLERRTELLSLITSGKLRLTGQRIAIVGTNGKGSTAYYLSQILSENAKTGLFTSPHLLSVLERIQLDTHPINPSLAIGGLRSLEGILGESYSRFSYFEILTILAIFLFIQTQCEFQIYEAGLGGRLDATKISNPQTVLLTSIGLDHTEILGSTPEEILREKIQIAGDRTQRFVCMRQKYFNPETLESTIRSYLPDIEVFHFIPPNEFASYLEYNQAFANFAGDILGFKPKHSLRSMPGRMEKFTSDSWVFGFDTAHNPDGIETTLQSMRADFPPENTCVVFATLKDRSPKGLSEAIQKAGFSHLIQFATDPFSKEFVTKDVAESIEFLLNRIMGTSKRRILFLGSHQLYKYFLEVRGSVVKSG